MLFCTFTLNKVYPESFYLVLYVTPLAWSSVKQRMNSDMTSLSPENMFAWRIISVPFQDMKTSVGNVCMLYCRLSNMTMNSWAPWKYSWALKNIPLPLPEAFVCIYLCIKVDTFALTSLFSTRSMYAFFIYFFSYLLCCSFINGTKNVLVCLFILCLKSVYLLIQFHVYLLILFYVFTDSHLYSFPY
jgi:hypothetical protein